VRRFLPAGVAALGVLLVVAGVVVFVVANTSGASSDFGWTAYAPLDPAVANRSRLTLTFGDRWTVLWTGRHLLGALLVVLGLLALAAVGGWLLGRRTRTRG
jgi:heme/copper-type cytochrome/quinol oxidase subunit 1